MSLHWSTHAHVYQQHAAAHLYDRKAAALWLSPGYGKTSVTLHAFKALRDAGQAKHMLVVAPLRVVQTVWAQEVENWATLNGLVCARLHGTKKEKWLRRRDVNVWLINYEGLPWLAEMAKKGKLPFVFDVVVFDEVRRMKNSQSVRFKAARPLASVAKYRWGLTGTPASNGLMDLFGQFLILDDGAALGTRITRYRHDYFEQHYDGFTWVPRPGAQKAIEARIEDYIFRADGHLDLPDFVYDNRTIELEPAARKTYTTLKNDLIASLGGATITAANAAVLMGKLKQMANGRVYDEGRAVHEIHKAKQDALRELVDEMGDEQLLIAYEYNHDLEQIREVLGEDVPYLGAGVSEKTALDHVAKWNKREIQFLAAHPASAGHGLNLQKGGAHHILWWGPTFDLDHYIQFNDRLRRQGNEADAVVVHTFVTEKTVDETAIKAREEKDSLQTALLKALTAEFADAKIQLSQEGEITMTTLQFKSDAALAGGQQTPTPNPFAQGQAPAQNNPFGGFAAQPAATPAQSNPFGGQQAAAQQPTAAQGNPFAAQGAGQQAQTIREDVAHAPPPTPQQAFASFGAQTAPPADPAPQQAQANPFGGATTGQAPAVNPFGAKTPVEDAQVVEEPKTTPIPDQPVPPAETPALPAAQGAGALVPFFTYVPEDKLADVVAAVGRVLKK